MKYGKTFFTTSLVAILLSLSSSKGFADTPASDPSSNQNIFTSIADAAKKFGSMFSIPADTRTNRDPFMVTRGTASYYADQFQGGFCAAPACWMCAARISPTGMSWARRMCRK